MYTITRKFTFDAGHRVYQHESKCRHAHGHTYHVEIEVGASSLDNLGRVIDFGEIKRLFGSWIDANLDHGMILYERDPLVNFFKMFGNEVFKQLFSDKALAQECIDAGKQKVFVMNKNPTAENIAEMIHYHLSDILRVIDPVLTLLRVIIHETPNCRAEYRPNNFLED